MNEMVISSFTYSWSQQHAAQCGGGEGLFLLLRETTVLVVRSGIEGWLFWSPYLDEHGEEDKALRRGKPLFLDPQRYDLLRQVWLQHKIADAIVTEKASSTSYADRLVAWRGM